MCTVPSAAWRVLMITGLMPGTAELRTYELGENPAARYTYVFSLSAVQLLTGYLTVGLVKPWGTRLFGRKVPLWPVIIVGTLGGIAVLWLFNVLLLGNILHGQRPDAGLVQGPAFAVMAACYAPILLWAPLELASIAGYWRMRSQA